MTALTFITPPLGLDPLTNFTLKQLDGAQGLYSLQSTTTPSRRMYLLDPEVYVPDYHPHLAEHQAASIRLRSSDEAAVYVIANHHSGRTTVNLLAPIVINTSLGTCAQVILEDQDWPLRAPLEAAG
jgi:flagellar assembly factor FliW